MRKVEFTDLNGKRSIVYFHQWVLKKDDEIVALVEGEDGRVGITHLKNIRFID